MRIDDIIGSCPYDFLYDSIGQNDTQSFSISSINKVDGDYKCADYKRADLFWQIISLSEHINLITNQEFSIQSNVFIGNSVGYDPEEKTVGTIYQTCYAYADGFFISKVYVPSNNNSQYKSYVHLDQLRNVRVITDSSGTVKCTITYEPFGKPRSSLLTWKSNVK